MTGSAFQAMGVVFDVASRSEDRTRVWGWEGGKFSLIGGWQMTGITFEAMDVVFVLLAKNGKNKRKSLKRGRWKIPPGWRLADDGTSFSSDGRCLEEAVASYGTEGEFEETEAWGCAAAEAGG